MLKYKTGDSCSKFTNMNRCFNDEMALISRKGSHPYELFDTRAKLTYKNIPPKNVFYSQARLV